MNYEKMQELIIAMNLRTDFSILEPGFIPHETYDLDNITRNHCIKKLERQRYRKNIPLSQNEYENEIINKIKTKGDNK